MKSALIMLFVVILTGCATTGLQKDIDVVRIGVDGTTYLNKKCTPLSDLSTSFTKDAVIIEAPSSTPYSKVVEVLKEVEEAGITQVAYPSRDKLK